MDIDLDIYVEAASHEAGSAIFRSTFQIKFGHFNF